MLRGVLVKTKYLDVDIIAVNFVQCFGSVLKLSNEKTDRYI